MALKIIEVDGVGSVKLIRRRGLRSLRLSVDSHGMARLSLPWWVSTRVGVSFVRDRAEWIASQQSQTPIDKSLVPQLRIQAQQQLLPRLRVLANQHGFRYNSAKIRKLSARWGSCSQAGDITLNLYLVQLPPELVDYVLLHELTHTVQLHHGADFWNAFESVYPGAKKTRARLRRYRPGLQATDSVT